MSKPLDMPQVSVIMPVRNADVSVRRAVESVQRQTLDTLELIVVDDGSTDRTIDILNRIADRDIRVSIIRLQKVGMRAACNVALRRANGTYVLFLEASSWLEPHALEDMLEVARDKRLDLVIAGSPDAASLTGVPQAQQDEDTDECVYTTQAEFRAAAWRLFDAGLLSSLDNKLFVRERMGCVGLDLDLDEENLSAQTMRPTESTASLVFAGVLCNPFVVTYLRDIERVGVVARPYGHRDEHMHAQKETLYGKVHYEELERDYECLIELYRYWRLEGDPASMEVIHRRYLEQLAVCLYEVCAVTSKLSASERNALVERMLTGEHAQLAAQIVHPHTRAGVILIRVIRMQNVPLAVLEGRLMSLVARRDMRSFVSFSSRNS